MNVDSLSSALPTRDEGLRVRGRLAIVCVSLLSGWAIIINGARPASMPELAVVIGSILLTVLGLGEYANVLHVTREKYRQAQQSLAEHARQLREAQQESQRLQQQELVARLATTLATDVADVVQVLGDGAVLLEPHLTDALGRQVLTHMRAASTRASQLLRLLSTVGADAEQTPQSSDVQCVLGYLDDTLPPLFGEQVTLDVLNTANGRPLVNAGRLEQVLMHLALMVRDTIPGGGIVTLRAYDGLGDVTRGDGRRTWTIIEVGRLAAGHSPAAAVVPGTSQASEVGDLGMALVQHVVIDAGGRLDVERRGAMGTQFILQLPSLAA